ncbi:hypothetical protein F7725_001337 [Dissostichus mawsoni]|uniref:Uncharacterized protein n=1 Tax=Dissostichus mawsoni TaxID=36200 RepID=A0A7J5ZGZ0_DISMA|nr:hypothetical protein F7725_001337 [Dissostichus mawsoni]
MSPGCSEKKPHRACTPGASGTSRSAARAHSCPTETTRNTPELLFIAFYRLSVERHSSCRSSETFPAAASFSFVRPAVEYRALPEDFKHQLSRRTGGNLTWHDGRGQKSAGGRAVKLLQQPGTGALQYRSSDNYGIYHTSPTQPSLIRPW